jgi:hypothetical protein
MCQPLCRFRPWECTAIGRGLIPITGVVIALYGIVFIIYISWHIHANFLAALAGLVGPGPAQYEYYAGGLHPSAIVLYLVSFLYPVLSTPDLVLRCQM